MFFVYVVVSANGRRYTGHSSDLERRLSEHNSGLCKTTKVDTEWKIAYTEMFPTRSEAMTREKWLKTGAGRRFLDRVLAGWSPPEAE